MSVLREQFFHTKQNIKWQLLKARKWSKISQADCDQSHQEIMQRRLLQTTAVSPSAETPSSLSTRGQCCHVLSVLPNIARGVFPGQCAGGSWREAAQSHTPHRTTGSDDDDVCSICFMCVCMLQCVCIHLFIYL